MKILLLSPVENKLIDFFSKRGDQLAIISEPIEANDKCLIDADYLISYRYQHIIKKDIIDRFPNKIINLHISLLPWNRGADPNLWSFLEDTPKGVSIHYIDQGIDTGDILVQEEVFFNPSEETLSSTYDKLCHRIQELFMDSWDQIINNQIKPIKQNPQIGNYHKSKDKEQYLHLLIDGYNTSIDKLIKKAL